MDIDLIIGEPVEIEATHNPRNLYKLEVISIHGPNKRSFTKVALIENEKGVIPRLKIILYYFELIEKLGYIPNNEFLLESFERKVYDDRLEIDSAQFWNHIVGYDMETGMSEFATPSTYKLTFYDNNGIEKKVDFTITE